MIRWTRILPLGTALFILWSSTAQASEAASHADPVVGVLVALAFILVGAKLGGEFAVRLGQPSVLGELLFGIVAGNLARAGVPLPDIATNATIDMFARIGVVILLFEIGLESTVTQMVRVGARAFLVAIVGVVIPIIGGFIAGRLLMPDEPWVKALFLGAALCATSVGITARVFREFGVSQSREARVVLGAAVIDDVLGLVVLTLVSSMAGAMATGQQLSLTEPLKVVILSAVFLAGAILLGPRVSRLAFALSSRLRSEQLLLPIALGFAFSLAALANVVQLAPIVGAYAAGLVLEEAQYKSLINRGEHQLEELIHPIAQMLVPIFFVVMGARVDLRAFADPSIWLLAGVLCAIALVSKLACGWCVERGYNRLAVGLGMVPRGEVGLIFADAGRALKVNGEPLLSMGDFSAIIVMVLVTTMAVPPLLGWAIRRQPFTDA
jgi:Kef-type K+ transport system membrane component KefB